MAKNPSWKEKTAAPWILDATCSLVDQRTALVWTHMVNQQERRTATRRFQAEFREDRRCRVRKSGEEIESLVANYHIREVWKKIQRWYQESKGRQAIPNR